MNKISKLLLFPDFKETISLSFIRENKMYIDTLNMIIKENIQINGCCKYKELKTIVHSICPDLNSFCNENKYKFKITSAKDKGLIGKKVEFELFGNLPNSKSESDMIYGDIKTTHFKRIGKHRVRSECS